MFSKLARLPILLAVGPSMKVKEYDIPRDAFYKPLLDDKETGWDRVGRMFKNDDFGAMSLELNSIYQATTLGLFTGAVYGGFLGSRKSYMDFMERNQATAFASHLDAKRKLQDQVTMGFAKNAFRFGWRLALFTFSYTAVSTSVAVYRGKSSMIEYIAAGAFTGGMYKFNMGLKGMTAGVLVGGFLGTIAGGITLLLLTTTGMTMEESRYWQYKWRQNRDETIQGSIAADLRGTERDEPLFREIDARLGRGNLDIAKLEQGTASQVIKVESRNKANEKN